MSNVQNAIQEAANRFAHEIVSLLRGATLSDILAITGKAPSTSTAAAEPKARGRRGRRPAAEVAAVADKPRGRGRRAAGKKRSREEVARLAERVLECLKASKNEMGVSGIADTLKVPTADLGLPLSKLRADGKVKTHGQKRSTVYRLA